MQSMCPRPGAHFGEIRCFAFVFVHWNAALSQCALGRCSFKDEDRLCAGAYTALRGDYENRGPEADVWLPGQRNVERSQNMSPGLGFQ